MSHDLKGRYGISPASMFGCLSLFLFLVVSKFAQVHIVRYDSPPLDNFLKSNSHYETVVSSIEDDSIDGISCTSSDENNEPTLTCVMRGGKSLRGKGYEAHVGAGKQILRIVNLDEVDRDLLDGWLQINFDDYSSIWGTVKAPYSQVVKWKRKDVSVPYIFGTFLDLKTTEKLLDQVFELYEFQLSSSSRINGKARLKSALDSFELPN